MSASFFVRLSLRTRDRVILVVPCAIPSCVAHSFGIQRSKSNYRTVSFSKGHYGWLESGVRAKHLPTLQLGLRWERLEWRLESSLLGQFMCHNSIVRFSVGSYGKNGLYLLRWYNNFLSRHTLHWRLRSHVINVCNRVAINLAHVMFNWAMLAASSLARFIPLWFVVFSQHYYDTDNVWNIGIACTCIEATPFSACTFSALPPQKPPNGVLCN